MDSTASELQTDRALVASEEGFKGTFVGFIEWLRAALSYGDVSVHEEAPNGFGRSVVRVETATGGYSSDEHLLGRLGRALYLQSNWVSSHRGGGTVYEFPMWLVDGTEDLVWLEPEDGVFERLHRVRRVRIYDARGGWTDLVYAHGAELQYEEPDRDINESDALLIIRPLIAGLLD